MNIDLAGSTAVVTGSTAGIGWGAARGLAEAGATVVLCGRTSTTLERASDRLTVAVPGADVRTVAADLTTAAGCAELLEAEPRCEVLVNNLGSYEPKPFFDSTDEDWDRSFQVNVMPGVRLSRAYLPYMIERRRGRVVFLSSVDGVVQPGDALHYAFTKAGILGVSRALARLAGTSGVTVNAVLPGVTRVEWLDSMIDGLRTQPDQTFDAVATAAVAARYPTSIDQRVHSVEEVANLIVYLCSPLASATTGSALRADGGIVESIV